MELTDLSNLNSKRQKALNSAGIFSVWDLINLFPRRYLDRSNVQPIRSLSGQGEEVTVVGKVTRIQEAGYGRKKRLEVIIQDETAALKGVWFKGVRFFKKTFNTGDLVSFYGKAKRYGRFITIAHPDVDQLDDRGDVDKVARIVPVYPSGKEFAKSYTTSKLIRQWVYTLLKKLDLPEFLPQELLQKHNLPEREKAYWMIHFPQTTEDHQRARHRFKFEELLLFQLSMARVRREVRERHKGHRLNETHPRTAQFFNQCLPFELTEGQKSALADIKKDVRLGEQMNRLIQGDVGSGKTVVAIGAMLMAIDSGYQTAFMAPTEILAEQHFRTLTEFLKPLDINMRLLVGNQRSALRTDILTDIEGGNCPIVVGTHAIIQEQVHFNKLGLVVVDEQHRFGVMQRAELLNKGDHPHVLVMSATPIPRSLAMTLYSDLDISVIKGLPAGRKPIKTAVRSNKKREDVYNFIHTTLQDGGQAYFVYPLVEESEVMDLKDATVGFKRLKERFPDFEVGLLHGQMKSEEKEKVMRAFLDNEIQILVSTTVIEVGVDVANANIMVIEHAERFGLSQLHQLRGRIGRGERQSYCILMAGDQLSKDGRFRLKTMAGTDDGFKIAEADLKLRGPGDFMGTKQSGLPEFKVADLVEDQPTVLQTREAARRIINEDPKLQRPDHQPLKKVFEPYYKKRSEFYKLA